MDGEVNPVASAEADLDSPVSSPPCFSPLYLSPGDVWGQLGTPLGTQPFLETQGYPSVK